jgi:hypothetical protein
LVIFRPGCAGHYRTHECNTGQGQAKVGNKDCHVFLLSSGDPHPPLIPFFVRVFRGFVHPPSGFVHAAQCISVCADRLIARIVYTVPLQLLAYHVAVLEGTGVDRPVILAKSVTVE